MCLSSPVQAASRGESILRGPVFPPVLHSQLHPAFRISLTFPFAFLQRVEYRPFTFTDIFVLDDGRQFGEVLLIFKFVRDVRPRQRFKKITLKTFCCISGKLPFIAS
jgi:hypothetical protein